MIDYQAWLEKVKAALDGRIKLSVVRWLAGRLGQSTGSINSRLHHTLSGKTIPQADFSEAVNAWLNAGCPSIEKERDNSKQAVGGKARAKAMSPERRKEIAKRANAARRKKGQEK